MYLVQEIQYFTNTGESIDTLPVSPQQITLFMKRINIYHFSPQLSNPIAANRKPQRRAVQHHGMLIASYLLVLLVDAHLVAGILVLLESVRRHLVKADGGLVGVLDQDVLAVVFAHDHVDESTDDGPTVVEVEVHLAGELAGLVAEHAEDDVV